MTCHRERERKKGRPERREKEEAENWPLRP